MTTRYLGPSNVTSITRAESDVTRMRATARDQTSMGHRRFRIEAPSSLTKGGGEDALFVARRLRGTADGPHTHVHTLVSPAGAAEKKGEVAGALTREIRNSEKRTVIGKSEGGSPGAGVSAMSGDGAWWRCANARICTWAYS